MTIQDLTRLVALGEGLHIEFKRRVPEPRRMAKEVIAFANTEGGNLLVGVGDAGEIVGVRDAEEEAYSFRRALQVHGDPQLPWQSLRVQVSKKRDVIVIKVPASPDRPHFLVDPAEGIRTAYVRVKDMSIEASREAVRLMRADRTARDVRFEFGQKELKLMRYLETYGQVTVEQFSRLAHIPRRRASQTLVLMARARVLTLHLTAGEDYFTLAYEFPP